MPSQSERHWDLRLVPAAALGWLTAWTAPLLSRGHLLTVAAAASLAAVAILALRPSHPASTSGRRKSSGAAASLTLAGLALVAGTAAAHVSARDDSPLLHLGAQADEVALRLRVTESIRVLGGGTGGPQVLVPAQALGITCDRPCGQQSVRSWALRGNILVFAPAQGWSELAPGATVSARVSIAAPAPEDLLVAIAFARGPPEGFAPPDTLLDSAAASIRAGLRQGADRTLGHDEAGLVRGIVLGETAGMDPILVEDFRISGLSHLTAVSGTNCAIVMAAVLWPLRRVRCSAVSRALIAALALAGFVILVGPQPSVLRAAAMGAISLLALATGRARQAIPALAATVLILLALDPALARDLGFALSVAATAGIVLVAGFWTEQLRLRGWPEPLAVATAVSAAAGLFTAPLLVLIVARVSLISLPANLLVVPVVALVTVLGLLAGLVSPLWPWAGEVILRLTDWPLRWMVWIAERAARTPGAALPWPQGVAGAIALAALIVVTLLLLRRRRTRWLVAAACIGIVVSGISIRVLAPSWPPQGWVMVACDVGQGDALVVSVGAGRAIVVDAGPDPVLVDGCLRRLEVQQVPLLILSHLHADHVDGLSGVLRGRNVGAIGTSLAPPPVEAYARIRRVAEQAGVSMMVLRPGETRVIDTVTVEVLGPVARYANTRSEPNNSSVVARLRVGQVSLLTTGDIEVEAQGDLLRRGADIQADVLKVAHHGSAYQDPDFLAAVGAAVALISVGAGNDYGHPDETLMDRLLLAGTAIHRTDDDGDIAVVDAAGPDLLIVGRGDPISAPLGAAQEVTTGDRSPGQLRITRQPPPLRSHCRSRSLSRCVRRQITLARWPDGQRAPGGSAAGARRRRVSSSQNRRRSGGSRAKGGPGDRGAGDQRVGI